MAEKKETWVPIAAGMTNGPMLVVVSNGELFIVNKRPFDQTGYTIQSIPFDVLRKCGLNIVEEEKSVLARVKDLQHRIIDS